MDNPLDNPYLDPTRRWIRRRKSDRQSSSEEKVEKVYDTVIIDQENVYDELPKEFVEKKTKNLIKARTVEEIRQLPPRRPSSMNNSSSKEELPRFRSLSIH